MWYDIFFIMWIIYSEVQRLKKRFQFIFSSMLEREFKCPLNLYIMRMECAQRSAESLKNGSFAAVVMGFDSAGEGRSLSGHPESSDELPWKSLIILPVLMKPQVGFEPNGCRCTVIIRSYICIAQYDVSLQSFQLGKKR